MKVKSEVTQSCLTLCNPMDYRLPGSSIHGIFQARVLEWVAISFSRGSSWPRDWTWVFCIAGRCFTVWATREANEVYLFFFFLIIIFFFFYFTILYWFCQTSTCIRHGCTWWHRGMVWGGRWEGVQDEVYLIIIHEIQIEKQLQIKSIDSKKFLEKNISWTLFLI